MKTNSPRLFVSLCFSAFAGINTQTPQITNYITIFCDNGMATFLAPSDLVQVPPSSLWPSPLKKQFSLSPPTTPGTDGPHFC